MEPFVVSGAPLEAFARLRRSVAQLPRTVLVTATDTYLHAKCRTKRGFVDDLECRLSVAESLIHVRSASRVSLAWDLGVNRKRVETLRRRMRNGGCEQH